jgi:hypothetical protein
MDTLGYVAAGYQYLRNSQLKKGVLSIGKGVVYICSGDEFRWVSFYILLLCLVGLEKVCSSQPAIHSQPLHSAPALCFERTGHTVVLL